MELKYSGIKVLGGHSSSNLTIPSCKIGTGLGFEIQRLCEGSLRASESRARVKVLSLLVKLQLKVVKGSELITYSHQKLSDAEQQLRFNYLCSQYSG